ncbi:ead/Ea22-like family protein [Salmonella enterica subsp. enterica serovar Newport]|uniref:Ead/Ea22-like family protein n=1 Tax=Salmonella enterica TaxID=28901 RepID=A0A5T2MG72_SALER|nr:ead/Ea22-like family protein [Salmonella enterica]ECA0405710.1 ead/Ea22-like family protein [Salmonella enterica subsp. enterica serovar Newport]EBL6726356.1 ead/Ea22-like family protein [Salmonella enterica]EEI2874931.1 ead/Ea22-like family protein [Salmonella enterica]EIX8423062.1 ead/Ea22-like family protein [Salmonella enterica]
MQEVKIYTASPSDLSPPVQSESFCVDMVLASDYAELEEKFMALAVENELARKAVQAFCDVVGDNTEVISEEVGRDGVLVILEAMKATGNMPATDAFLAEVRAQAHKEGAYFVANRMLATWDAGFIDDTAKNAADIARMILTSTEFMADAPEGDFDRSFADGVIEDIAAQLRKGAVL